MAKKIEKETDLDIIKSFKEFAKESELYFHDDIERWKGDREFAGGGSGQWNSNDSTNRGSNRSEVTYNFIANYVNAVTNPFKKSPYSLHITPVKDTSIQLALKLNAKIKHVESGCNAKFAYHNAVKDAAVAGMGYAYVTTDEDEIDDDNDSVNTAIYPVLDSTMVIPDPFSKEVDGSDSEQSAIVEFMSKTKAKSTFGEDVVTDSRYRLPYVSSFGDSWKAPEGSLALVTWFRRVRKDVVGQTKKKVSIEFFKMIGDKIVARGKLGCPYIPIVPFKGGDVFRGGKKISVGIVDVARPVQKNINYTVSQLRERIAKAPKPLFMAGKSAVEGQEEYYENIDKSFNPLVIFNDKDDKGQPIQAPQRMENSVQTQDLSSQIDANISYMSLLIGMPSTGLVGSIGEQETAESVLMRSKSSESNQSHIYENAKSSIKHIGRIVMYFLKETAVDEFGDFKVTDFEVTVQDGPELITSRIEARKDLLALSSMLPETMKPLVAYKMTKTLDFDGAQELAQEIHAMLPPELKPNLAEDPHAKEIMDQMSQQLDAAMSTSTEKDNTITQLQTMVQELQNDSRALILKTQMDNANRIEIQRMKDNAADTRLSAQIQADAEAETSKLMADVEKKRLETEKRMTELGIPRSMSYGIPNLPG